MASDLELCPKKHAEMVYIYGEVFIWKRTVFGKNNREGGLCHTLFVAVFGMREVVMTLFMQKFKEGVVHFPGLYDLLVNLDLKNSSTVEDLMSDEMHAFGRALLENPDRFSLWMEELFRLADGLEETEVYHRCDAVYKVWQYLQKHSTTQVWLPYQTPAANNQFRYLNRKTTVRHIPKV